MLGASMTRWRSREDFEPPTFGLGNRCSIQLSYGTVCGDLTYKDAARTVTG